MDDNNLFKFDLPNHNNNKTKSYNYLNNYKNQEQNDKLNQNVKLIPHNIILIIISLIIIISTILKIMLQKRKIFK